MSSGDTCSITVLPELARDMLKTEVEAVRHFGSGFADYSVRPISCHWAPDRPEKPLAKFPGNRRQGRAG